MKKVIKFIRNNMLGFLVGLSLCLNGVIIAENMITSEQVSYSNDKTSETTVKGNLDELFSAVDINERLGNNDISTIGEDGTITGAISAQQTSISERTKIYQNDYDTTNQLTAASDAITSLKSIASWKVIGIGSSPKYTISNYNLYGEMTISANISKGTVIFTPSSNTSVKAINYFSLHFSSGFGSTYYIPIPFTIVNKSNFATYTCYYYNKTFATTETIPAGTYVFTFSYSV